MVSTQGRATTQAALTILKQGGTAMDAAIATSFAIGVERPQSTGVGGGGFLLFRDGKTKKIYAVDYRERAPLRATRDMYLDAHGNVIADASTDGIRAVAVPGLMAGLLELHARFGTLPLKTLLLPAIQLAEQGFPVYPQLAESMESQKAVLGAFPASKAIFLHPDGTPYQIGQLLVQPELGRTLRRLADTAKPQAELRKIEQEIVTATHKMGGLLRMADFDRYHVNWRTPITGSFTARGKSYAVVSMPPPSSGGTHVIEILNILENDHLFTQGFQSAVGIHEFASAEQLAFADRAEYMGDPDFYPVPAKQLASKEYADRQHARIRPDRHTPSAAIKAGQLPKPESDSTSHFSIMDDQGNVVSSTQTINGPFGSGVTVPGLGIVLNDEMDDFSVKPGVANMFGAIGGDANAIAPGKTPLSSMSPTIILDGERPILAVGARGGTRIISCVAETILNYLEYGLPLYDSANAIRVHHQWQPDVLSIDSPGPSPVVIERLKAMGYTLEIKPNAVGCKIAAVAWETVGFVGSSDPVDHGSSAGL